MKIALVQGNIVWEDVKRNLIHFTDKLSQVSERVSLVVFPEAFTSGFTMNPHKIQSVSTFPVLDWLMEKAFEFNKSIAASAFVKEKNKLYNRMYWVNPDGTYQYYDKKHLFSHAGEDQIFTPGNKRVIVEKQGFKFNLQICYDLRFPVWAANRYDRFKKEYEYDVLLYVAHWPAKRKNAYLPLLRARAIENQSYVLWVNRVGRDGQKNIYSGDSRIIHPDGKVLATAKSNNESVLEFDLNLKELNDFRMSFPTGPDMDEFTVTD